MHTQHTHASHWSSSPSADCVVVCVQRSIRIGIVSLLWNLYSVVGAVYLSCSTGAALRFTTLISVWHCVCVRARPFTIHTLCLLCLWRWYVSNNYTCYLPSRTYSTHRYVQYKKVNSLSQSQTHKHSHCTHRNTINAIYTYYCICLCFIAVKGRRQQCFLTLLLLSSLWVCIFWIVHSPL